MKCQGYFKRNPESNKQNVEKDPICFALNFPGWCVQIFFLSIQHKLMLSELSKLMLRNREWERGRGGVSPFFVFVCMCACTLHIAYLKVLVDFWHFSLGRGHGLLACLCVPAMVLLGSLSGSIFLNFWDLIRLGLPGLSKSGWDLKLSCVNLSWAVISFTRDGSSLC